MPIETRSIRKSELAAIYGISSDSLRKLLNEEYREELEAVGYRARCITLSPKVVRKFIDLYGEPIRTDEI